MRIKVFAIFIWVIFLTGCQKTIEIPNFYTSSYTNQLSYSDIEAENIEKIEIEYNGKVLNIGEYFQKNPFLKNRTFMILEYGNGNFIEDASISRLGMKIKEILSNHLANHHIKLRRAYFINRPNQSFKKQANDCDVSSVSSDGVTQLGLELSKVSDGVKLNIKIYDEKSQILSNHIKPILITGIDNIDESIKRDRIDRDQKGSIYYPFSTDDSEAKVGKRLAKELVCRLNQNEGVYALEREKACFAFSESKSQMERNVIENFKAELIDRLGVLSDSCNRGEKLKISLKTIDNRDATRVQFIVIDRAEDRVIESVDTYIKDNKCNRDGTICESSRDILEDKILQKAKDDIGGKLEFCQDSLTTEDISIPNAYKYSNNCLCIDFRKRYTKTIIEDTLNTLATRVNNFTKSPDINRVSELKKDYAKYGIYSFYALKSDIDIPTIRVNSCEYFNRLINEDKDIKEFENINNVVNTNILTLYINGDKYTKRDEIPKIYPKDRHIKIEVKSKERGYIYLLSTIISKTGHKFTFIPMINNRDLYQSIDKGEQKIVVNQEIIDNGEYNFFELFFTKEEPKYLSDIFMKREINNFYFYASSSAKSEILSKIRKKEIGNRGVIGQLRESSFDEFQFWLK